MLNVKGEKVGSFTDEDVIFINEQFTSPLKKIQFPTPVLEEVYKKCKFSLLISMNPNDFVEIVEEDRSIAIEAACDFILRCSRM